MFNKKFLITIYILSIIVITTAGFFKILHLPYGEEFIILALIFSIFLIVFSLYEIWNSKRIDLSEKIMWTVSFIFFSSFATLIYILVARKRILRDFKLNL